MTDNRIELTDEEKEKLEKEAAKEVADELLAQEKKIFKDSVKKQLKKKALFTAGKDETGEDLEAVTINLAPHAPHIRLDNRVYYHGMTYRLTKKTAATVKEVAYRTWTHDAEVKGLNMNEFLGRQKINQAISPTA